MNRMVKWIVIVLVVLLGFTYATYAYSYQGNYNVSVTVPIHKTTDGGTTVSASGITTESNPTSVWQFWSFLQGASSTGTGLYAVYCELNLSWGREVQHRAFDIASGQDIMFAFEFGNIEPGQGNIHVYILDQTLSTKLYDHNWGVTVG
jgi:hypothetical protein